MQDPEAAHLGDAIELYALGQAGDLERARVEEHVRTCDACASALGEAETAVLRLIESDAAGAPEPALPPLRLQPRTRSRPPLGWIAAVAAAFLAGLLPWGAALQRERASEIWQRQEQAGLDAMLNGHFLHAPFTGAGPAAPAAKVVFARDGRWLYVITGPGPHLLSVAVETGSARTVVATLPPSAGQRSVLVRPLARANAVVLLDGDTAVATAHLAYPASAQER